MKDFLFIWGAAFWIFWGIIVAVKAISGKYWVPERFKDVIAFLAITLVTLSWYII